MLRAYAVAAVRAAEERALGDLPDDELMQRAAHALAALIQSRLEERSAARALQVVVLAGPGDNGGDALWAAALVRQRRPEQPVQVVGVGPALHERASAAAREAGVPLHHLRLQDAVSGVVRRAMQDADLVVDGLLGIGGRPGLVGSMAELAALVPPAAYTIAVDLPSGADPDGLARGPHQVRADETIALGAAKPVHLLPTAQEAVGTLTVVDLGLDLSAEPVLVERLQGCDVATRWPVPGLEDDKYSRGVVGVVAGGERYPGAAVLACTAAAEAGAGMIRYIGTPTPTTLVLQSVPEAVPRGEHVQAWVVGPGLDIADGSVAGRAQSRAARRALEQSVPCVVDAGGLDLLPDLLEDGPRPAPTLLTPHAGELARLLTALDRRDAGTGTSAGQGGEKVSVDEVRADPVAHARRAARLTGATVLLKGATTLVVDPREEVPVRSQAAASAWLATAGAGDVLAGLCGVLLAAGLSPREAGSMAALVHARAAERANPGGPVRALAVAQALPTTIASLLP